MSEDGRARPGYVGHAVVSIPSRDRRTVVRGWRMRAVRATPEFWPTDVRLFGRTELSGYVRVGAAFDGLSAFLLLRVSVRADPAIPCTLDCGYLRPGLCGERA